MVETEKGGGAEAGGSATPAQAEGHDEQAGEGLERPPVQAAPGAAAGRGQGRPEEDR